jgi:hypothetical protein
MARQKRKAPRAAVTARRAKVVVSGKPTRPHKPFVERLANARAFLARRHRVRPWSRGNPVQVRSRD